jgi:hypothetical protein
MCIINCAYVFRNNSENVFFLHLFLLRLSNLIIYLHKQQIRTQADIKEKKTIIVYFFTKTRQTIKPKTQPAAPMSKFFEKSLSKTNK